MLNLHLREDEYLTINGNITVKIKAVEGRRTYLSIDAPREMPIVRGALWERNGGKRPECLKALPSEP